MLLCGVTSSYQFYQSYKVHRQASRETNGWMGKWAGKQIYGWTVMEMSRLTGMQTNIHTDTLTERQTDRQTERQMDRLRGRQTDRQMDRQTDG